MNTIFTEVKQLSKNTLFFDIMKWILKRDIKKGIKGNAALFASICQALEISPYTLPDLLRKDDPQLTQKAVLEVISKALEIDEEELLEEFVLEEEQK